MDELPFVTPVYKRDLTVENYFGGYLLHPYISFYTGRGCKSRCTFCLWPQTVGGHAYRVRSVGHVIDELKWAVKAFPQVKEYFFDDDTLTDNLPRVEELAARDRQARHHLVVQRQGQRAALDLEGPEGQRLAAAAGRLRVRQPEDPAQHQEGHAGRRRQALQQGLPRTRHRHPRHLHPRPAGRDQGDHRGDDQVRHRDQPAHHPGVAGRALSRHLPAQAGDRERLVRHRQQRRAGRFIRRPDRAAQLSASDATPRFSKASRTSTSGSISACRRSLPSSARCCARRR